MSHGVTKRAPLQLSFEVNTSSFSDEGEGGREGGREGGKEGGKEGGSGPPVWIPAARGLNKGNKLQLLVASKEDWESNESHLDEVMQRCWPLRVCVCVCVCVWFTFSPPHRDLDKQQNCWTTHTYTHTQAKSREVARHVKKDSAVKPSR